MIDYEDFIAGEKFIPIVDHAYNHLNDYQNIYPIPNYINPITIYCHTEFVNRLFEEIKNRPPFVLVSHNGDGRVTINPQNQYDADINKIPPNLIHWFGQNVNTFHPKITSLPIGLENSCWFPEINKQWQIYKIRYKTKHTINLCYMNFSLTTNLTERTMIYDKFKTESWITCDMHYNGHNFENYLDMLYYHPFSLCPAGNPNGHNPADGGTATHRFWECLYCEIIPIVIASPQTNHFLELPTLIVNSWNEITKELLLQYVNQDFTKYDLSKLKLSYWKEKINERKRID